MYKISFHPNFFLETTSIEEDSRVGTEALLDHPAERKACEGVGLVVFDTTAADI
jgi:hypothetical protein